MSDDAPPSREFRDPFLSSNPYSPPGAQIEIGPESTGRFGIEDRHRLLSSETTIRALGISQSLYGAVLVACGVFLISLGDARTSGPGVFFVLMGGFSLALNVPLMMFQGWARAVSQLLCAVGAGLTLVLGALLLILSPGSATAGSLVGSVSTVAYTLFLAVLLNRPGSREVCTQRYRGVIRGTPGFASAGPTAMKVIGFLLLGVALFVVQFLARAGAAIR